MALAEDLRHAFAPPHPAGRPFILGGVLAVMLGVVLGLWITWLGLAFILFCLFFFRDPERVPPLRRDVVVAPADGRVVSVGLAVPPAELGLGGQARWQVCIFLSVLNVHVNRAPADGTVTRIAYRHGAFLSASLDKASTDNERNALALRIPDGREMAVVQIAGLIARRIVCNVREGDSLRTGERFGIIRFGSRTDLYLPDGVRPVVVVGQTMIGGETVIAGLAP
jgi:phosphatidylserine decarboxylase